MVINSSNEHITISKKRLDTATRIIKVIKESNGLLTLAARKIGLNYSTVWRYTQEFPSVKQAVHEAKETMLDFAEGKLYENMRAGDNTAIIFFLKTQGKQRGYIEKVTTDTIISGTIEHQHEVKVIGNTELKEAVQALLGCGAININSN